MTHTELARLLEGVVAYKITATEAIRRLIAAGHDEELAAELVFVVLGGSDLIIVEPDGTERYEESGRTIAEVEADMDRTDPIT